MVLGENLSKVMKLKHKVLLKRAKLVPSVGLQAFIPRKIKKIVGLVLINICIWTMVFEAIFTPRVIVLSGSVVSNQIGEIAVAQAKEIGEPNAIEAKDSAEGSHLRNADSPKQPTIEEYILNKFGKDGKIALAIFKSESGLKKESKNYNCRYNGISTFCKPGDESKAWSVDCSIAQINVKGTVCPSEIIDPIKNIDIAYDMYQHRGFTPWVVYNKGYYLENM